VGSPVFGTNNLIASSMFNQFINYTAPLAVTGGDVFTFQVSTFAESGSQEVTAIFSAGEILTWFAMHILE